MKRNRTFRFVVKAVIAAIIAFIVIMAIKNLLPNPVVSAQQAANV